MDNREYSIFMGSRHQDECVAGVTCHRYHPVSGFTIRQGHEVCSTHGTGAGRFTTSRRAQSLSLRTDWSHGQLTLAFPFLPVNPIGYLLRSFDITRQFLFEWTVNWRFMGEETFLSREFSITLLIAHASLLALFLTTRWTQPSGLSLHALARTLFQQPPPQAKQRMSLLVTPSFILTTILTAVVIGLLCARSLHYQFYSYVAWTTPFLLWKTGMHPVMIYTVWAAQEWAWNVYPSTNMSSTVVVACLAGQVFGVWWGTRNDHAEAFRVSKTSGDEHSTSGPKEEAKNIHS